MYFIWMPRRLRAAIAPRLIALVLGVLGSIFARHAWEMGDLPRVALGAACFVPALLLAFIPRRRIFIGSLLGAAAIAGAVYGLNYLDSSALRPMAHAAADFVRSSASSSRPPASTIPLNGKILIWDVANDRLSQAQYKIPAALRATPQDSAVTIFFIWDTESRKVGNYHWPGESPAFDSTHPAYQDTADLAIITWPEPHLIGWHAVLGDKPPTTTSDTKPQHGDTAGPIAQWIRSLPGLPPTPPMTIQSLTAWLPKSQPQPTETPAPAPAPAPAQWTEKTAQSEAVRRYPQLGIANSPMNHAFVAKYKQLKATNSAYLRDPAWPLHLADEVAKQPR